VDERPPPSPEGPWRGEYSHRFSRHQVEHQTACLRKERGKQSPVWPTPSRTPNRALLREVRGVGGDEWSTLTLPRRGQIIVDYQTQANTLHAVSSSLSSHHLDSLHLSLPSPILTFLFFRQFGLLLLRLSLGPNSKSFKFSSICANVFFFIFFQPDFVLPRSSRFAWVLFDFGVGPRGFLIDFTCVFRSVLPLFDLVSGA